MLYGLSEEKVQEEISIYYEREKLFGECYDEDVGNNNYKRKYVEMVLFRKLNKDKAGHIAYRYDDKIVSNHAVKYDEKYVELMELD